MIPARSWAGAVPTLLTHEALDTLCRPCAHPQKEILGPELSPLERFLGCVSMKRNLQRLIQSEESVRNQIIVHRMQNNFISFFFLFFFGSFFQPQMINVPSNDSNIASFKVDSLQCQVFLNPTHMQSLHLKLSPLPNEGKLTIQWSNEELLVIEQFFDSRVAAPPYRPTSLNGFSRTLNLPPLVLKDAVQLMRLDLAPELLPGAKWNMQFCMRVPPSASPQIVPVGNAGVLTCREKILFFVSF